MTTKPGSATALPAGAAPGPTGERAARKDGQEPAIPRSAASGVPFVRGPLRTRPIS